MDANSPSTYSRPIHRCAVALACATLGLVAAGALVTSKQAGLAVPDWPTSYGSFNPPGWLDNENIRAEHGHRLIAGSVGLFTLLLTVAIWRSSIVRPRVKWLALAALAAVLVQALLGGLTVLNLLPHALSISHAMLGQTFFCLTVALALITSPAWRGPPDRLSPEAASIPTRWLSLGLLGLFAAQLLVGAISRHLSKDAGLALFDFPLSHAGAFAPPLDPAALNDLNVDRRALGLTEAVTAAAVLMHFLHRIGAAVLTLAVIAVAAHVLRYHRDRGELIFPTLALCGLLALQISLGILTVLKLRQPHLTTAHVAVGAATLACAMVLCLESFHVLRRAPAPAARAASAKLEPGEAAP